MKRERRNSEEHEIRLEKKLDEKVEKKLQKEKIKAEKRKKSKFRNSKFGKKWFALAKWKRITVYVIVILLLLLLLAFGVVYGIYNGGFRNAVDENNLGISSEIEDKYGKTDIFNVAVFGVDTRDENSFSGRSDSIIIVSVDRKNNTVKLSSILRDSYVAIEGHKNQKITHAYAFGGAELAIKTINQNFGMNITDYATINFYKLGEAIDVLGGIDMYVTEEEFAMINAIGDDDNPNFHYLESFGDVHLTGEQAVVYARIRKIDSDVERSNRQRKVIEALLTQARKVSPTRYAEVARTIMSLCETSLSFTEVMSFAPMIKEDIQIQSLVIPGDEDNAIGGIYDGSWVWRYDLKAATNRLHLFIYGEVPETTAPSNQKSGWGSGKTTTNKNDNNHVNKNDKDNDKDQTNQGSTTSTTEPTTAAPPSTDPPATEPPASAPGENTGGDPQQPETPDKPPEKPTGENDTTGGQDATDAAA